MEFLVFQRLLREGEVQVWLYGFNKNVNYLATFVFDSQILPLKLFR